MPFPRFGPVFTAHFRNGDFAGANCQPAVFNSIQPNTDFCAPFSRPGRFSPAIGRDRSHAGFHVEIGRNRLAKHRAEKFHNRVFSLRRRSDGNAPERFGCFHFFNWWGKRLSRHSLAKADPREQPWHCKNRLAGSLAPPKTQLRYKVAPRREVEQFDFV